MGELEELASKAEAVHTAEEEARVNATFRKQKMPLLTHGHLSLSGEGGALVHSERRAMQNPEAEKASLRPHA